MISRRSQTLYLILITIILTNLTQVPDLIGRKGIKLLTYIPWMMLAFICVVERGRAKRSLFFGSQPYMFVLSIAIVGVCCLLEVFDSEGFSVSLLTPLLMCLFIYVISINSALCLSESDLNKLLWAYILSTVIVTLFVYKQMIGNGFSWTSKVYAYDSKNSVSQIILTAILFLTYLMGKNSKIVNLIIIAILAEMVFTLFMLKSRATLLGLVVVFASIFLSKIYSKKMKIIGFAVLVACGIVVFFNSQFRNFFVESIVFAGRDRSSINSISSGRVEMIKSFPQLFFEKPLLGYGKYYIESMPLDSFIETGFIGGICFNIIAVSPIVYAAKTFKKYKRVIDALLLILAVCYYINGLFEQLAPFGPGVKCYMLWLLFGFSVAWRDENYENTMGDEYAHDIQSKLF